jgi:hypothetical protein
LLKSEGKEQDSNSAAKMTEVYKQILHGKKTWVVKRAMRLINNELKAIMSRKGCDASNMFDEELPDHEQEFSDDEVERE